MKLLEIFGVRNPQTPTRLGTAARKEIKDLLGDLCGHAERASAAVESGDVVAFRKAYNAVSTTKDFIDNMILGRGPREFK